MESPNLNFSIVNAVLFGRRTICCFQAKPHIFLYHGFDTPFLRPRLYLWHFRGTAAIGKTPEIRGGNRVWRIPPSNTLRKMILSCWASRFQVDCFRVRDSGALSVLRDNWRKSPFHQQPRSLV